MAARPAIFTWRQTEPGLTLCAVRWYLRYLSRCAMLRNYSRSAVSTWRPVQDHGAELEQRLRRHRSRQTRLSGVSGGSASDSRLGSSTPDPGGASSTGGRRQSCSSDSVHREPFQLGSLTTHDRRSATNLPAFETCHTTIKSVLQAAPVRPRRRRAGRTQPSLCRSSNCASRPVRVPSVRCTPCAP